MEDCSSGFQETVTVDFVNNCRSCRPEAGFAGLLFNGARKEAISIKLEVGIRDVVLTYKETFRESFKCRICATHFYNPEELRMHRIVQA